MDDWNCHVCGEPMFLKAYGGQFHLVCPRRHDGHHPEVRSYTSNGTGQHQAMKEAGDV